MNRKDYISIDAENFSNIKRILDSPAAYKYGREDKPDTIAFAVGKLSHAMVLENKDLRDLYVCKPEGMSFSTKEGKAWKSEQTKEILSYDDYMGIPKMAEAVANDPDAAALLRTYSESEVFIDGEIRGVKFKGIIDKFGRDESLRYGHLDFKTVQDARPFKFAQTVDEMHYDLQDEIYSALIALKYNLDYRPASAWITIEKSAPFEVACYYPTPEMIAVGEIKLEACIQRLKACRAANKWPKSLGGMEALSPSSWSETNAKKLLEFTV